MESSSFEHPTNPNEDSSYIAKLFFLWTIPFLRKGFRKVLSFDDVYAPLSSDQSEFLGNRIESIWYRRRLKSKRTSLLQVIYITFWRDLILLSFLFIVNELVCRLGMPLLLGYFLGYFREDKQITYNDALMYASGIVFLSGIYVLSMNHVYHLSFHIGMKARMAVCSLIYRKALRLSQTSLGENSPGKIVNLLSNDVNRFEWASYFMNNLWALPMSAISVAWIIWIEIGYIGLIGVLVIICIVPIQSYSGRLSAFYRLKTALRIDERVRFMDEIISGVQVLKMYAWEKPFGKLISYIRKRELENLRTANYARAVYMTFQLFTGRVALFCTMLATIWFRGPEEITAQTIFTISTYLTLASYAMSQRFARAIGETAEVLVALKRIRKFLELEEKDVALNYRTVGKDTAENPNLSISMQNVSARWTIPKNDETEEHNANKLDGMQNEFQLPRLSMTLENLNIDFPRRKLIGVVGSVGAGKSSVLQALLRELPVEHGSISTNGSISYASQEPWVFSASVRRNILFGQEYDCGRYNAVVRSCALTRDFSQLENGDLTIVGERGVSLSGGQKARVNLARVCYRDADIYLLDDPLSAVDAHVGTHIFDKCIGPRSRLAKQGATRILVTHQIHFLKEADWLVVLKDGKVKIQGKPSDLSKSDAELIELIGDTEAPQTYENFEIISRENLRSRSTQSSTSTTESVASNDSVGQETKNENYKAETDYGVKMEASSKGSVKGSLTLNYFRAGADWSVLFILILSFLLVQLSASATDYWVSVWTKQEEMRLWPSEEKSSFVLSTMNCIYVHVFLVVSLLIFTLARAYGFSSVCIRISRNIHNVMFGGIIDTNMQFFDRNPSGRIMNRFSQDLGAIDEFLPKAFLDSSHNILTILGAVIVAIAVNPYLLVPFFILVIIFFFVQKVYLRTSQQLKRLDGIAKSPAFTHLAATLNGLATVRAFNSEEILKKEFDTLQDTHSACWFMSIATTSLLTLSMDFMCTIFVTCTIFYYLIFEKETSGAKVGLAASQVISLTGGMLSYGVRQAAEFINQITSVERVLEYRDLEREKQPKYPLILPETWPSRGCIVFRNVFYIYSIEGEPVLRDLSFMINSMEKIGIVGRTGAGKSSLIGALFRLACVEGKILIDGIDTSSIRLNDLRKQIAIIPQDPVLFSGTLRRNLDPFEDYSDGDIWSALEGVELKNTVSDACGLQSTVLPRGSNYSVGQRQLLCLARAILRKNRILVLDEATANVDPQTDLLIQQTIRQKFTECTVLTVAHRLHTIIDSDRVMVMDAGKVVEFDEPHNLLQNQNGIFYGMVEALGEFEFDRLALIAQNKFNEHQIRL